MEKLPDFVDKAREEFSVSLAHGKEIHLHQLKPAYNIQYGTDSEFVTWATVGPQPTDTTTLIPFLQEMNTGRKA